MLDFLIYFVNRPFYNIFEMYLGMKFVQKS